MLAAQAGTTVVLPTGVSEDRRALLVDVLAAAGWSDVELVNREELIGGVGLVEVDGLPSSDDCPSRVSVEAWRERLDAARERLQLLAFGPALADLVALDVDLVCLASPPAASDLFRLELAVAEAHTFLAESAGKDAGKRSFHKGEARAALVRAASFGATLSPPADLHPDVLAAYERARRERAEGEPPRVIVAGPGARVGARFNGRPLPEGAFEAVPGTNLVEAADGAEVTAAARVRLTGGSTLVWLSPDGAEPLDVELGAALRALDEDEPPRDTRLLMAALAHLVVGDDEVLFLSDRGRALAIWEVDGSDLRPRDLIALPAPAVDRWRAVIGAGPTLGWSSVSDGPLDGLDGLHAGAGIYARVAVMDGIAVAARFDPWGVATPVPESRGGGTLFRAAIPATVGVRFGPRTRTFAVEGGIDVGIESFGTFEEADGTRARLSFYADAGVGLSAAISPGAAFRLQAWFGPGLGYLGAGSCLSLEARL